MEKEYRLRYAPSPTGFLHIGNTRTALMNYLFAKHYQGKFIVRLEDTDIARNVDGAIESQFDNLQWLGIVPDESILHPIEKYGPYQQSLKFGHYVDLANELIAKKLAYKCFCTPEELEAEYAAQEAQGVVSPQYSQKCLHLTPEEVSQKEAQGLTYSVRFLVPKKTYVIDDLVRGQVSFEGDDLGDFIIIKSNGIATYNFAVVVDDYEMAISHVVRGEEHISNTPRQLMIYEAFNWTPPQFAHLTLIVDENHKKLSKRSGNALFFIEEYRKQGYLPQAIFNYIALLGWSPVGEKEIFNQTQLIEIFDETRFSKSPSTFDMVKMKWVNSQYMKMLDDDTYLEFVKQFIDQSRFALATKTTPWLDQVLLLYKTEIEYGSQINDHLDLFFNEVVLTDQTKTQLESLEGYETLIQAFSQEISQINSEQWNPETIQLLIKNLGVNQNKKGKNLFMPLRIFATKLEHGPALAQVIYLLGQDQVLKNIATVQETISN